MQEIWADIEDYEQYYEVSNIGNVRNKKTQRVLIGDINNAGYKRVMLSKPIKKFFIHRLVAYYFCDGYSDEMVVNHKDGNKQNNVFTNLEWITHSENDLHAVKNGLRKNPFIPTKPAYRIKLFNLTNNETIAIYCNSDEFIKDYCYSKKSIEGLLQRGWFYENRGHRSGTKIGIKNIKPND